MTDTGVCLPVCFFGLHLLTIHTNSLTPMNSSSAFSTPAIWCRVFQFRVFQSRVFPVSFPQFVLPIAFRSPFPSPSLSLSSFLSSPTLEVEPNKIQLRGLGSAVSSPAGSGAESQLKSNLVHFSCKNEIWWQRF